MSHIAKSHRSFLSIVRWAIIPLLLLLYQTALAGPPLLPHQLYGTVTLEGQTASTIQLHVGGQSFSADLIPHSGTLIYEIDLPTDDPDTAADEGGTDGQPITVTLPNGHRFDQTIPFASGEVEQVDLTMGPATCLATVDDGATVFISADGSAVQRGIDAASSPGTVKLAGSCVGLSVESDKDVTVQGGYASNDWLNQTSLTVLDADNANRVLQVQGGATMVVENVVIRNGSAENGGGIWVAPLAELTIRNSHIISNSATADGGGIYAEGTLNLYQTTVEANAASGNGGGIYSRNGRIENSTLSGNSATNQGGGLYVGCCRDNSIVDVTHSTLASNSAAFGANVFNAQKLTLGHTILANGDGAGSCVSDGTVTSNNYNLVEDGNCLTAVGSGLAADDLIVDALLDALTENGGLTPTHALQVNSPAIAVGGTCPATDQRGVVRPAACDSGAFQTLLPDFAFSSYIAVPTTTCLGQSIDFTFAVVNEGVADSGLDYALYDDAGADGTINQVQTGNVPSIAAGAIVTETFTYTPTNTGTRRMKLLLDHTNSVVERDETNNLLTDIVTVQEAARPFGSLSINDNADWSTSLTVNLMITSASLSTGSAETGACKTAPTEMRLFIDNVYTDWMPYQAMFSYTLPSAVETIYVQLRDAGGVTSELIGSSIAYDLTPPSATVYEPTGSTEQTDLTVSWLGEDAESAVESYQIDVQQDGGAWQTWIASTEAVSATYSAQVDSTYCFRATATNVAGLIEAAGNAESCVSVERPKTGVDLFGRNLSIFQRIELDDSLSLIENYPALVRLDVGVGDADRIENVTAQLHAIHNGVALNGSPITSYRRVLIQTRSNSNSYFRFRIPRAWLTPGTLQFYVEIDTENSVDEDDETNNRFPASGYITKQVEPVQPLELTIVPVHWQFQHPRWASIKTEMRVDPRDIAATVARIRRLMPVNVVSVNVHTPVSLGNTYSTPPMSTALEQVRAIQRAEQPNLGPNQYYIGLVASPERMFPQYSSSYWRAQAGEQVSVLSANAGHHVGRSLVSSSLRQLYRERDALKRRLQRAYYNYYLARIDYSLIQMRYFGTTDGYDAVANARSRIETTREAYRLMRRQLAQFGQRTSRRQATVSDVLYVSGQARVDGLDGAVSSAFAIANANVTPSAGEVGDFRLALYNSAGEAVYAVPFDAPQLFGDDVETVSESFAYNFTLPMVDDLAAVRLYFDTVLLDEIVAGPVPTVAITSAPPTTGDYTLAWTGDADTYYVRYSADNGTTWSTLTQPITATHLLIDADYLSGGTNALLEVIGSRELSSSAAQLGPFTIAGKLPDITIDGPIGTQFEAGQTIPFVATAIDLEDGVLDGASLVWSSSLDGAIGISRAFDIATLPAGTHTITLTATDSDGNVVSTTFEIDVLGDSIVDSVVIDSAGLYEVGVDGVTVNVVNTGNCLDSITVVRFEETHPNIVGGLATDGFWRIMQTGCGVDDTFSVNITLPYDGPAATDELCRWAGPLWECGRTVSDANSITRNNVQVLGDWAVGRPAPTDVALQTRDAQPVVLYAIYLALIGVAFTGFIVRRVRQNETGK